MKEIFEILGDIALITAVVYNIHIWNKVIKENKK